MRRVPFIFMILVVAVLGYNYYQITQIRSELRTMNQKLSSVQSGREKATSNAELIKTLESAKLHSNKARDLLARGKVTQARSELEKSLHIIDKATELLQQKSLESANTVEQAVSRVRTEMEKVWRDFLSEAKKKEKE